MICVVVQYQFSDYKTSFLADINIFRNAERVEESIEDVLMRRYGANRDQKDLQYSIIKHYG